MDAGTSVVAAEPGALVEVPLLFDLLGFLVAFAVDAPLLEDALEGDSSSPCPGGQIAEQLNRRLPLASGKFCCLQLPQVWQIAELSLTRSGTHTKGSPQTGLGVDKLVKPLAPAQGFELLQTPN